METVSNVPHRWRDGPAHAGINAGHLKHRPASRRGEGLGASDLAEHGRGGLGSRHVAQSGRASDGRAAFVARMLVVREQANR